MIRLCEECGSDLIHHDGSSNWECSNGECPVSFHVLRRVNGHYEVVRTVYVTVL